LNLKECRSFNASRVKTLATYFLKWFPVPIPLIGNNEFILPIGADEKHSLIRYAHAREAQLVGRAELPMLCLCAYARITSFVWQ
jgi:hypothetical protein